MEPNLQSTVEELAAAVEVVLNPITSHEQRRQAYEVRFLSGFLYYRPPSMILDV